MSERILLVDDDQKLLDGYRRNLDDYFGIDIAQGPEVGLEMINGSDPYAVIVADMRMPVMDGIEFLLRARSLSPLSVRMMLTGNSDLDTVVEAVNQGNIFKFLMKPCPYIKLIEALKEGINEYRSKVREMEAATIDSLTGLHNRKRLKEKITEESEFLKRYGETVQYRYSVVFIDLDNFKYYNDTFGHPLGDLLLKKFADILKSIIRASDFAARYGGDEFILLLRETDLEGAGILAKRIKDELLKADCFLPEIEDFMKAQVTINDDKRLGCSIGIAGIDSGNSIDLQELLKRADDALLSAKRSGKNRFVFWNSINNE